MMMMIGLLLWLLVILFHNPPQSKMKVNISFPECLPRMFRYIFSPFAAKKRVFIHCKSLAGCKSVLGKDKYINTCTDQKSLALDFAITD